MRPAPGVGNGQRPPGSQDLQHFIAPIGPDGRTGLRTGPVRSGDPCPRELPGGVSADPFGPAVSSVDRVRTIRLQIAVLALVLAACGDGGPAAAPEATPAPTTAATVTSAGRAAPTPAAAPPVSVPDALKFSAQGLDGAPVVGADYAGRDVALWFWAPW